MLLPQDPRIELTRGAETQFSASLSAYINRNIANRDVLSTLKNLPNSVKEFADIFSVEKRQYLIPWGIFPFASLAYWPRSLSRFTSILAAGITIQDAGRKVVSWQSLEFIFTLVILTLSISCIIWTSEIRMLALDALFSSLCTKISLDYFWFMSSKGDHSNMSHQWSAYNRLRSEILDLGPWTWLELICSTLRRWRNSNKCMK